MNKLDRDCAIKCSHPKDKHAFDIVITSNPNPCKLSCLICFDEETERLKKEKKP